MDERRNDKAKAEIALQARLNEKSKRSKGKWASRGKKSNFQNCDGGRGESSSEEENCGTNKLLDSSNRSYKLLDNNCNSSKNAAETRSEQNVMVTFQDGVQGSDEWYLDYGFSTHMTGRKDWFVKINQATKNEVKFADDTTLAVDGVGDVLIIRRDGGHSLIRDVLYIFEIKCNLLSIGQFLEKDYMIRTENKILRIFYRNGVLVFKAHVAANMNFKKELKVMERRFLDPTISREEWLWHYRLRHLNFLDLNALQRNGMVIGLPKINISAEMCEECVKGKLHKSSFNKDSFHSTYHDL
ncbi:uncharacterized protein LOC131603368 [Vicia villosa]|uniref:uncharacterized protein LOC131603368 n=1 Tax=Vicia villosa TaxID=3911 RepID=UPI00273C7BA0|nr:uncharacterized protein LOC131603368 [Vicia villosa]